jgi:transcriptional regulator with XRE-family HTH domain
MRKMLRKRHVRRHKRRHKKGWATRVEALVKRHGTAEAVAAALGVSFLTVRRWLRGENAPSRLAQQALKRLRKRA